MHQRIPASPAVLLIIGLFTGCASSGGQAEDPASPQNARTSSADAAKAFERTKVVRWSGSADSLFAKACQALGDTFRWSRTGALRIAADKRTVGGRFTYPISYRVTADAGTLEGKKELSYDLQVSAIKDKYKVEVRDVRIDGRPPADAACWVPCDLPPYTGPEKEQHARLRQAAVWEQVTVQTANHLDGLPGTFLGSVVRTGPPDAPTR